MGLLVVGLLLYGALALAHALPVIYPDELLYAKVSDTFAHGHGLAWRGSSMHLRAALYPYAIAPAWLLPSTTAAYGAAKLEGTLFLVLTAVPIWWLGRRFLPPRVALATAALSLAGTWMIASAELVTEVVALPLATAALAATVGSVRWRSSRAAWWAIAFGGLAAYARLQLAALLPVIFCAVLLDAALSGHGWRARLRDLRGPLLAVTATMLLGGAATLLLGSSTLGGYSALLGYTPPIGRVLNRSGLQLLHLITITGYLPLLLAIAASMQRSTWRDPVLRSLLVVLWPAVVLFSVESGFFLAGFGAGWGIQRYVIYPAPLALLFAVCLATRGQPQMRTLGVAAAAGLFLLAMPAPTQPIEERAVSAISHWTWHVWPQASAGVADVTWAAATASIAGVALLAIRRRFSPAPGMAYALAIFVALGACLALQSAAVWGWDLRYAGLLAAELPPDRQVIDHRSSGPVGVLLNRSAGETLSDMELFNRRIASVFVERQDIGGLLQGWVCDWHIDRRGVFQLDPGCPAPRRDFLIADPRTSITFYGERQSTVIPHVGRLVHLGGPPRARSIVIAPCARRDVLVRSAYGDPIPAAAARPCADTLDVRLWLDAPASLRVVFSGAPAQRHAADIGTREYGIPPGRVTTIALPVQAGAFHQTIVTDWHEDSPISPHLAGVEVVQGHRILRVG